MASKDLCPVCGGDMQESLPRNALSRANNQLYICSTCGAREALQIGTGRYKGRRLCLYFDEVGGIMLVTEDEPGYLPFGKRPPDAVVAQQYCDNWNARLGLSSNDVSNIVASSMFGRWQNF